MFTRGLVYFLLSVLLSWLGTQLLNHYSPFFCEDWKVLMGFFTTITIILFLVYNLARAASNLAQILLVCVVIRLLLCMIFAFYLSLGDNDAFLTLAMHLLLYFVVFTVFDLLYLFSILKKIQNAKK